MQCQRPKDSQQAWTLIQTQCAHKKFLCSLGSRARVLKSHPSQQFLWNSCNGFCHIASCRENETVLRLLGHPIVHLFVFTTSNVNTPPQPRTPPPKNPTPAHHSPVAKLPLEVPIHLQCGGRNPGQISRPATHGNSVMDIEMQRRMSTWSIFVWIYHSNRKITKHQPASKTTAESHRGNPRAGGTDDFQWGHGMD